MTKKLIGLFLIIAMLASCFVACDGDDKDNASSKAPEQSVSGESAESNDVSDENSNGSDASFGSLSDKEKLFYLSEKDNGYVDIGDKLNNILDAVDEGISIPGITQEDTVKLGMDFQLTELNVGGVDILKEQFGGSLGFDFKTLFNVNSAFIEANASVMRMSVNLDVKGDKNGTLITSPFIFKTPVFIDTKFISSMAEGVQDPKALVEALKELCSAVVELNKDGALCTLLVNKTAELIPDDAVASSKVSLGNESIASDAEADCVVLTLNAEQLAGILGGLRQFVSEDESFKALTADLTASLAKLFELGFIYGTEDEKPFESIDGLYASVFEAVDEAIEELKKQTDFSMTLKRYFVNEVNVRVDAEVSADDDNIGISCWDIYEGESNNYGIVLTSFEDTMLELKGNSEGDKTEFSLKVNDYAYNSEMGEDGIYQDEAVLTTLFTVDVKKDGGKYVLSANASDEFKLDFEYAENKFNATAVIEGTEYKLDGTVEEKDGGVTVNAKLKLADNEIELICTRTSTVKDTETAEDIELKVKASAEGKDISVAAKLTLTTDLDSEETIEAPVRSENDFVIDAEEDFEGLTSNFTSFFLSLINGESM